MGFGALVRNELVKTFIKPRTYISFIALAILCLTLQFGFKQSGDEIIQLVTGQIEDQFEINGIVLSSNFICYLILQFLIVQMPLLVALVAGDSISGETTTGSLRYLLIQPHSRTKIYLAKRVCSMLYTTCLLIFLGILALVVSKFIFPNGDLIAAFSDNISITRAADCNYKFMQAFAIAFLALSLICSFALMLSAIFENSIVPIVIVMSTIIIFTVIGTFDLPVYDVLRPFMFTTHMIAWRNLFENEVPWSEIYTSCAIMLAHILGFTALGIYLFNKKEITC
jgi:ABC-2 type transport system permease protein